MSDTTLSILIKAKDSASAVLKKVGAASNTAFGKMRSALSSVKNSLLNVKTLIVGYLGAKVIGGLVRKFGELVDVSNKFSDAMIGLQSTAKAYGHSQMEATEAAKTLAKDGLLSIEQSAQSIKNLLGTGMSVSQALDVATGMKDMGAFNNIIGDLGQAMVDSTKGIKTNSLELIENIGMTTKLGTAMNKAGFEMSDLTDKTKKAKAVQALHNIIMEDAAKFQGDAAIKLKTYGGLVAQIKSNWAGLNASLGDAITKNKVVKIALAGVNDVIDIFRGDLEASKSSLITFIEKLVEWSLQITIFLAKIANWAAGIGRVITKIKIMMLLLSGADNAIGKTMRLVGEMVEKVKNSNFWEIFKAPEGTTGALDDVIKKLEEILSKVREAKGQPLDTNIQADTITVKPTDAKPKIKEITKEAKDAGEQIKALGDNISSTLGSAFADLLFNTKNAADIMKNAFKAIASTIISTVVSALIKAILYATVLKAIFTAFNLPIPIGHEGGTVPAPKKHRGGKVPIKRYHTGGEIKKYHEGGNILTQMIQMIPNPPKNNSQMGLHPDEILLNMPVGTRIFNRQDTATIIAQTGESFITPEQYKKIGGESGIERLLSQQTNIRREKSVDNSNGISNKYYNTGTSFHKNSSNTTMFHDNSVNMGGTKLVKKFHTGGNVTSARFLPIGNDDGTVLNRPVCYYHTGGTITTVSTQNSNAYNYTNSSLNSITAGTLKQRSGSIYYHNGGDVRSLSPKTNVIYNGAVVNRPINSYHGGGSVSHIKESSNTYGFTRGNTKWVSIESNGTVLNRPVSTYHDGGTLTRNASSYHDGDRLIRYVSNYHDGGTLTRNVSNYHDGGKLIREALSGGGSLSAPVTNNYSTNIYKSDPKSPNIVSDHDIDTSDINLTFNISALSGNEAKSAILDSFEPALRELENRGYRIVR